jgi:hypothetical protein
MNLLRRDTSLTSARAWLMSQRAQGAVCPCCDQTARTYRRPLSVNMCMFAVALYRAGGSQKPVHGVAITGQRGGDEARLQHWGIIKPSDVAIDGKTRGYWMLTKPGVAFVRNKLAVHSYALIYAGKLIELRGDKVKIAEILPMYNPALVRIRTGIEVRLPDGELVDHT